MPAETYTHKTVTYSDAIREMAIARSGMTLFNNGSDNAIIVLENILLQSKTINMFVGNFHRDICDDSTKKFEKSLKHFLLNKGKISVILNNYDLNKDGDNNIINILKQYSASKTYRDNIDVRLTTEKPIIDNNEVHYTVGDESMYRLEYDTEKFLGKFCFNDPDTCEELLEKFKQSFLTAKPLKLRSESLLTLV
ncbi:hypothetical protein [Fibrella forsythiae]|uniref:Uncharacterized protein n=1 Tax=Fibrella forsythiae TaxID=2817061 RepID=A0ABS3JKS4_9BACT|nr:hypothetical protein [Fibrella forsythiae]MBO0950601.1 hypothetical protein [Fibrella forsythiae]